ncbi:MAG: 30S ribosomal protein S19 [Rhodobacterales bacterium]|nr:30S ribosomal protein S19 [Rhodobacterales bacterium]
MSRSLWKGPFVDAHVLKKAEAARESGRNDVIKIWSRRSTILPQFVGLTFGVYNGRKHVPVSVSEDMIGQKFGEYSPTRTVDELIVSEAYVGKNLTMKRGRPRARGRFGRIIKPFSEITIKVRQLEEQA